MLHRLLDKVSDWLDRIFMNSVSENVVWWKRYIWYIVGAVIFVPIVASDFKIAALLFGLMLLFFYFPYCLLRIAISRDKRNIYKQRAGIAVLIMIVSFAASALVQSESEKNIASQADVSPEQKAYDDQAKYEEWIAWKEGQEKQKAYDDQAAYEEWIAWKEGQEKQKAYDDQAAYEEWIAWKEGQEKQEAYDNQAKYEEWIAWKQQKAYDDQAAYEEWIAWKQQNTPEALIKNNVHGIESLAVNDNGDGSYSVVISENAVLRTANDVVKYETLDDHKLNYANALDQCRRIVEGIQNSGVSVSDVTINLIGDVTDGNGYISKDNVVICNVPGNADCEDINAFQHHLNRFWTINGL